MKRTRVAQAGVTLVEMLLALAVSSVIGLASFILLDSVTRTEDGVAGRLDRLAEWDRMFRLLAIDTAAAVSAELRDGSVLVLATVSGQRRWHATERGVVRRVTGIGGQEISQQLSTAPAAFERRGSGILSLRLPGPDLWRLVPLPEPGSK